MAHWTLYHMGEVFNPEGNGGSSWPAVAYSPVPLEHIREYAATVYT